MARSRSEDERFSLTPQQYLDRYHIPLYLEDSISLVLESRDDRPLEAIHKYFNSVLQGNHVLLREFSFINATPRNRLAFIRLFVDTYCSFGPDSAISFQDHWQLTTLLCSDFPQTFHNSAFDALNEGGIDPSSTRPFKDISAFFQIMFVFWEFMEAVKRMFDEHGPDGTLVPLPFTHTIAHSHIYFRRN